MGNRHRFDSPDLEADVSLPLGISPDGRQINSVEELPNLPLPKKVIVGGDAMWVDGWVFRVYPMGKKTLAWLAHQAGCWVEEDPSPENKAQVSGVIEALETMIANQPKVDESKRGGV